MLNVAQSTGVSDDIWSKPGIEFVGGLGYKLGLKGKFGLGPLKFGAGFNLFDAEVGAGMSKGMYSKLDVLKGEITLGKASGSYSVFSSSYNFSTNEYDHTFFAPPSWDVNGGSVDNWDFGFSFQSGFVRSDMNINPVRSGVQGVLMMDSYAKYKTGQAPPTPIFTIINLIFGD